MMSVLYLITVTLNDKDPLLSLSIMSNRALMSSSFTSSLSTFFQPDSVIFLTITFNKMQALTVPFGVDNHLEFFEVNSFIITGVNTSEDLLNICFREIISDGLEEENNLSKSQSIASICINGAEYFFELLNMIFNLFNNEKILLLFLKAQPFSLPLLQESC